MAIFGNTGVGIDLGSSVTSIYLSDEEKVVLREPTCVLVSAENGQDVLAVGSQAHSLSGRTAEDTDLVKPIERGCVADVELTALLMVAQCEKAMGRKKPLEKATLLCSLPGGASRVSRSALFQAMTATGAKKIASLRTPVAAALGAGLDISALRGVLEICLGGGLTELAVLSMNGIAAMRSLPFGGETMDEDIVRWFWREKGVLIGMRTAEQLKRELGTVLPEDEDEMAGDDPVLVKGKEASTGRPASVETCSQDVKKALEESVVRVIDAMKNALYNIPPELSSDLLETGIQLSGGGALLTGLKERLEREVGVPVHVSAHPQRDVILGLGAAASDERLMTLLERGGALDLTGD